MSIKDRGSKRAKGTIDERILKALTRKEQTQTALMQAVKAELGGSR